METLTRLVTESLARHGFDRPLDYRRLPWSHWFRCESHHSLLIVPSKPGVFALAEEVMDLNQDKAKRIADVPKAESREPKAEPSRMLAVAKFFEDDDMAFVLDRMLSHENPLRTRLASGRYFIRFVVIEDPFQRRSVCNALNQWIVSSAEKATGIGSHFATSLEFTPDDEQPCVETAASPALSRVEGAVPRTVSEAKGSGTGNSLKNSKQADAARPTTAPRLNSAIDTTIHCSSSFPSGF
jgi:hypothetical protein